MFLLFSSSSFSFTNVQDFNHRRIPDSMQCDDGVSFFAVSSDFRVRYRRRQYLIRRVSIRRSCGTFCQSGIKPLVNCACFAVAPEQVHVKESVVRVGTKTVNTGTFGLYFATSLAVLPPCVKTTIKAARTFCAVRTADEAKDSNGIIGFSTCADKARTRCNGRWAASASLQIFDMTFTASTG